MQDTAVYSRVIPNRTEVIMQDLTPYLLLHMEKQHGKGKALTVLAHKLAQAVYYMLKRGVVFDFNTFLQSYGRRAGKPAA